MLGTVLDDFLLEWIYFLYFKVYLLEANPVMITEKFKSNVIAMPPPLFVLNPFAHIGDCSQF